MSYQDGYENLSQAGKKAAALSKRLTGTWYVIYESHVYHVLNEIEAFDCWCVRDDQIIAAYQDGEYLDG